MGALREYRHRTLEERLKLYSQVRELHATGLRPSEIAHQLGMNTEYVRYWLRVDRPCRNAYVPDLTPRPELAYLVGAYLGDGRTAGPQDKKVRFKVADPSFAELLNGEVAKILRTGVRPITREQGFYCVNYDSAVLYDYLQQTLEGQISLIDAFPAMFLRGFFDAEGYATQSLYQQSHTLTSISVGAANCNLEYLNLVRRLLSSLGIDSGLRVTNKAGQVMEIRGKAYFRKRDVYHVEVVNLGCVRAFRSQVDFSIPAKREKLQDLLAIMSIPDPMDRYDLFTERYEKVGRKWFRKSGMSHVALSAGQE